MTVKIEIAKIEDAPDILSLQKLAYQSEAKLYNEPFMPPLTETLNQVKELFKTHLFLKATDDGRIVGSVRANKVNGTCWIGRLIVHPDCQNHGIATQLLMQIEDRFSGCRTFRLFTASRNTKNIAFYQKRGYREISIEKVTDNLSFIFFEKKKRLS